MMMSERCTGDEEKVQTATLQYPEFDSSEKRAEFNRQRLTIKTKTTSSASGSAVELFDTGIYVGGAKVSENAEWIPYRGFSTISVVEFLQVSGNEREANIIKDVALGSVYGASEKDISKWWLGMGMFTSGLGLTTYGLYVAWSEKLMLWGLALCGLGYFMVEMNPYDNVRTAQFEAIPLSKVGYTNIFPITQAVEMAEGYNRQLWREITNR